MRRAIALLLMTTALSACIGGSDETGPGDDSDAGGVGPPPGGGHDGDGPPLPADGNATDRIELVDCLSAVHFHQFSKSSIQEILPPNFEASGLTSETATLNIDNYDCQAAVADNQTVIQDVSFAAVIAFVDVSEEMHTPGAVNLYVLEWFTDNNAFYELLSARGMPAVLAEITHTFQVGKPGGEATIAVDGEPWYLTTTQAGGGNQFYVPGTNRKFHHVSQESAAWSYANITDGLAEVDTRKSFTETRAGTLSRLPEASTGFIAASVAELSTRNIILEFGNRRTNQ